MTDQLRFELEFAIEPSTFKQFTSEKELRAFQEYERKCTVPYFKSYCQAYTPEDRKSARIALAKARLAAHSRWKELNAVAGPRAIA